MSGDAFKESRLQEFSHESHNENITIREVMRSAIKYVKVWHTSANPHRSLPLDSCDLLSYVTSPRRRILYKRRTFHRISTYPKDETAPARDIRVLSKMMCS